MAQDIVPSSSSWATSQMKPDTDEEANSLWAKNIADNTGWLFAQNEYMYFQSDGGFVIWPGEAQATAIGTYAQVVSANNNGTAFELGIWRTARMGTLYIRGRHYSASDNGTFFCSFNGNMFGTVKGITNSWTTFAGTFSLTYLGTLTGFYPLVIGAHKTAADTSGILRIQNIQVNVGN